MNEKKDVFLFLRKLLSLTTCPGMIAEECFSFLLWGGLLVDKGEPIIM